MITSRNNRIFIRDLSDLTLYILFAALWSSINVHSKHPIAWNNSRHESSWRSYLHCAIEQTSSPRIICIVFHQVFCHPSEHGTSSMGKYLLVKVHIIKFNISSQSDDTQLTSSTVNKTAFSILQRQGNRGIPIVSSQRKFIFDIQVNAYWLQWQAKHSKLVAKYFETSEFQQDTWDPHLILGFVLAHTPPKTVTNVELWQSYKFLKSDLVLPFPMTHRNICRKKFTLTVDAIIKQLLLWKKK